MLENAKFSIRKNHHQLFPLQDDFKGEITFLDCRDDKLVRRYIGAPFGKGKFQR
jgi:hypothetical protein